jgi:hypothetical protein
MDIPLIELSDEQVDELKSMLDVELATDLYTGEQISIQKLFFYDEIKMISEMVDEILTKIFDISAYTDILIEIFS